MSRVSAIIPAYNHAEFIGTAIVSVFAQNYRNSEVIVTNDGCPDDTKEFLQSWIESDQIGYFRQESQSVVEARNRTTSVPAVI